MNICLIRHGETDWNAAGRLQGREDIPLNENGRRQAEQCAEALRGGNWKAVFTSPLKRAAQSAEIIAKTLGIREIHEDADLAEKDYGRASGTTADERKELFPDGVWEGAEDWEALRDRLIRALHRSVEAFPSGDILIVSHGGAINALLAELSGHSIGTGKTRLQNACVTMLTYSGDVFRIIFYNKTAGSFRCAEAP